MIEEWKDIVIKETSYPYRISDRGNVKSKSRYVKYIDGRVRKYKSQTIKHRLDGKGYPFITLYGNKGNLQIRVHQLVALHFLCNPENKCCINHKDGIRTNNNKDNLEWCTYSENTLDGIKRGSIKNSAKKIDENTVRLIRDLGENTSLSQKEIGGMFSLSQTQISRILNNKNW